LSGENTPIRPPFPLTKVFQIVQCRRLTRMWQATRKFRGTFQSSSNLQRWIQRTEISIASGWGAMADRGYNHPSRSGKNDGVARRWVRNQVLISRRRECRTAGAGGAAAAGRDDEFDSEFCSDWHGGWRTAMAAMMAMAPKVLARYLRVEVNGLDEVFLLPDCRVASCCEAARWKY
jgi:hypothetical protein